LNYFNQFGKKDYANIAKLKDLMGVPPMTAEQHSLVMHKRRERRRMVEAAQELKAESEKNAW
jgi:hypothetical protein